MIRKGIVREIKGDEALVCPADGSECDTCEARHACLSLSGGTGADTDFWMQNDVEAAPGDLVELELKSSASLTIIASTFLVPVFLLFTGYSLMMNGSDSQRALGAVAGLLAGIVAALMINKRLGTKKGYNMQMTRVLEKADSHSIVSTDTGSQMEGSIP